MLLACASVVGIGILITFLRYSFWRWKFCQNFPGRKPGFFNVWGDLSGVWRYENVLQGFMDLLRERVKLHEKEQLFCMWFMYKPILFIIKADAAQEVLTGIKMNEKSCVYNGLHQILGTGLITSPEAKWKSRRRLLMPCFHYNILRNFMTYYNEGAENLVRSLQKETKKDFTVIENQIKICALDIICNTVLGIETEDLKNEFPEYIYSLSRVTEIFMQSVSSPWPSFIFWKTKNGREYRHHCQSLKQVTRKIIREKRECYLRSETVSFQGKPKALIDLLIQNQELKEEDIREEVDTFTIAGHETTATSISWTLFLIGLYPDVQTKLQEEIDQIFDKDTKRHVTERDLQDLQYLDCVLKESHRLYPIVPVFVRQATEDTTICGYNIPKGTGCAILSYFLHRDEDIFPEPDAFKPERFLPENNADIPMCSFIPFSAGPRKCIGYKFAEMEMKVLTCFILRNFTIESLDDRSKIQPTLKVTLQPSSPIRIRFRSILNKKE